jgi:hypothetical protein
LLAEQTRKAGVEVWKYCLMPNHVHIILTPERADGLGLAVERKIGGHDTAILIYPDLLNPPCQAISMLRPNVARVRSTIIDSVPSHTSFLFLIRFLLDSHVSHVNPWDCNRSDVYRSAGLPMDT